MFFPKLELYRLPSPDLIKLVRTALLRVNAQAEAAVIPNLKTRKRPSEQTQTAGGDGDGDGEREFRPEFNKNLWAVDSWEEIKSALGATSDVGSLLSPNVWNLPVWARPDFVGQDTPTQVSC